MAVSKRRACFWALCFCAAAQGLWKVFEYGRCPFWNLSVYHVLTNINGMGFGLGLLAAFFATGTVLFRREGRRGLRGCGRCMPLPLCFVLCQGAGGRCGGAGVLLCRTGTAAGRGRGGMRPRACTMAWALVLLAGFGALYLTFFSAGAGTSIHFSVFGTLEKSYFTNFIALIRAKWPVLLARQRRCSCWRRRFAMRRRPCRLRFWAVCAMRCASSACRAKS